MFFILSKVLYFLIPPLNWVLGIMLYGLITKNPRRRKRSFLWAFILAYFFSNQFISNEVVRLWELKTLTMDEITEPYDIGILLGGYSNSGILPNHDRYNFGQNANRFTNTLELYKTGKVKKLLLTGGSSRIFKNEFREASSILPFLEKMGIPKSDIIIEANSRNTHENALLSKAILEKSHPDARCLLITSASHLRRASGCFRKQGVSFTPFSVDHLSQKRRFMPATMLLPNRVGFYRWETLIKEWIGYVAYCVKGYI